MNYNNCVTLSDFHKYFDFKFTKTYLQNSVENIYNLSDVYFYESYITNDINFYLPAINMILDEYPFATYVIKNFLFLVGCNNHINQQKITLKLIDGMVSL